MNATLFIRLALVGAVVACGHYYAEYRVQEVRTEWQILNTQVIQEARENDRKLQEKYNEFATRNIAETKRAEQKIEALQSRLRQRLANHPDMSLPDTDFNIGLFSEAVNSSGLPPSKLPSFSIGEAGEAAYTLYVIGEYNACARQVNALIDAINTD